MSEIPYPKFATKWINIRKVFRSFYFTKQVKVIYTQLNNNIINSVIFTCGVYSK